MDIRVFTVKYNGHLRKSILIFPVLLKQSVVIEQFSFFSVLPLNYLFGLNMLVAYSCF